MKVHGIRFLSALAFAIGASQAVEFHGALATHHSGWIDQDKDAQSPTGDFLVAEERGQLRVSGGNGIAALSGKIDFIHDDLSGLSSFEFREGYLNLATGFSDLRFGRQVVTWGLGDMLFINDVFPKDYVSFFSGRNMEYLKVALSGFKGSLYAKSLTVDLVATPFFEPNRLPDPTRFRLADPFPQIVDRSESSPKKEWSNGELAMRVTYPFLTWDFALYGYHGYFRTPSPSPDSWTAPSKITYRYPDLDVYGASAQGGGLGGVLSLETGYYDSREDRDGTDPSVPNPEIRYLIGYQASPWSDLTTGVQYYGEYMLEYGNYTRSLPGPLPEEDKLRQVVTLRVTQFLKYQTIKLSFLAFLSPTDEDYYLVPEVSYKVSDELVATLGGNVFNGRHKTTSFAQMDANDNAYIGLRYEF